MPGGGRRQRRQRLSGPLTQKKLALASRVPSSWLVDIPHPDARPPAGRSHHRFLSVPFADVFLTTHAHHRPRRHHHSHHRRTNLSSCHGSSPSSRLPQRNGRPCASRHGTGTRGAIPISSCPPLRGTTTRARPSLQPQPRAWRSLATSVPTPCRPPAFPRACKRKILPPLPPTTPHRRRAPPWQPPPTCPLITRAIARHSAPKLARPPSSEASPRDGASLPSSPCRIAPLSAPPPTAPSVHHHL